MTVTPPSNKHHLLGAVAVMGISFWFFLGFPFWNHNESFQWLPVLDRSSFWQYMTWRVPPSPFLTRPLGQLVIWLGYKLSGGSIYPQQIINYVIAVVGWLILYSAVKEKRFFSLVALVTGGVFFSGYIYLFHLHGAWYSPVIVAIAVGFAMHRKMWDTRSYAVVTAVSLVCGLFYTLSFVLLAAYSVGLLLERRREMTRRQIAGVIGAILLCLLLVKGISSMLTPHFELANALRLVSFRTIEVNRMVSLCSMLLALITALSLPVSKPVRMLSTVLTAIAGAAFLAVHLPVVLLWILVCLIKCAVLRRWSAAAVLFAAAIYPGIPGGGTPIYAMFSVVICAAVTAIGSADMEYRLGFVNSRMAAGLAAVLLVALVALRMGVHVPALSSAAAPLLSEREKTFQMENIIRWYNASPYRTLGMDFNVCADDPNKVGNAVDRRFRPPTTSWHVAPYLRVLRGTADPGKCVVLAFGGDTVSGAREVYRVPGRFAGDAVVYLPARQHGAREVSGGTEE